jgi:hypothetical protein
VNFVIAKLVNGILYLSTADQREAKPYVTITYFWHFIQIELNAL